MRSCVSFDIKLHNTTINLHLSVNARYYVQERLVCKKKNFNIEML